MVKKSSHNRKKKYIIIVSLVFIFFIFGFYQNNHLTISKYVIQNEKIPESFDNYRIVQISDLHNKKFGKDNSRLIKKIEALKPDIIVITGDFIDSNHTNIEVAEKLALKLSEIAPTYYVSGNHEEWLNYDDRNELYTKLRENKITILDNKIETISIKNDNMNLIGLTDKDLCNNTLSSMKVEKNEFNILLAHEPQYISLYSKSNIDLVLAGHTHGGQFDLPFIGGVFAPDQGFNPEYTHGMYIENNVIMIVSRGLGNSVIPVRLFNYPEIVCINLKK